MKANLLMASAVMVALLAGVLLLLLAASLPGAEGEPMASGGILPPANPEVITPSSGTIAVTVVEDHSSPIGEITATVVAQ